MGNTHDRREYASCTQLVEKSVIADVSSDFDRFSVPIQIYNYDIVDSVRSTTYPLELLRFLNGLVVVPVSIS